MIDRAAAAGTTAPPLATGAGQAVLAAEEDELPWSQHCGCESSA